MIMRSLKELTPVAGNPKITRKIPEGLSRTSDKMNSVCLQRCNVPAEAYC